MNNTSAILDTLYIIAMNIDDAKYGAMKKTRSRNLEFGCQLIKFTVCTAIINVLNQIVDYKSTFRRNRSIEKTHKILSPCF